MKKANVIDEEKRKQIGQRFVRVREHLGLKQAYIEKVCGMSRTQVENIEKGKIPIPLDLLAWLNDTHNVSIDWIFSGSGWMFVTEKKFNKDVKQMIDDFRGHPEFMYRVLDEVRKKYGLPERSASITGKVG